MKNRNLNERIAKSWDLTTRPAIQAEEGDPDGRLPLPYPYTVPCADGMFQCLFYWDTYFANLGLLRSGKIGQAENNLRNFIWMIRTYGYIPNGSLKRYLTRSQPPFFGMMLRDIWEHTHNAELLNEGLDALKQELRFWNARRLAPNGLNRYSCEGDRQFYLSSLEKYEKRTGIVRSGDREYLGLNAYAEAESGWDFCGRFGGLCHEYNPVDLNSLLWFDERFLADHTEGDERKRFGERAEIRKETMLRLMRGEDGVFRDYRYTTGETGRLLSCASFFPQFTGMVRDDRGMDDLLRALELPHGLQASGPTAAGTFQWGAGNGWPCLQYAAYVALRNCGRKEDAGRIAQKYVALVERCEAGTGRLWEKYNVENGTADAVAEYETPEMYGWTAGVYQALLPVVNETSHI